MIDDELLPLLKTINEEVTVEDVYGIDFYYTDGRARGSLCKIIFNKWMLYVWATGEMYSTNEIMNNKIMDCLNSWICLKITSPESSTCPSGN